jgi:hypothetical protein
MTGFEMARDRTTILAAASAGSYWDELMLLAPTLGLSDVLYATTDLDAAQRSGVMNAAKLPDCSFSRPFSAIRCAAAAARLVLKHRPGVVISTGGAPGLLCLVAGRMIGARTLWIDSMVFSTQMSRCGKLALTVAHECWVQWEHLAQGDRPRYFGSVV